MFLFAIKMTNARIHLAGSAFKKTQVPNSQATKNSIKVTIWGKLADLIFLWAYRLAPYFSSKLQTLTLRMHLHVLLPYFLNRDAGMHSYAVNLNTTKGHCVLHFCRLSLCELKKKKHFLTITLQPFSHYPPLPLPMPAVADR